MRKRIIAAVLALTVLCTGALADFNDVPGDAWYAEAVSWAQENGIMDGVAEGVFEPDGAVTRAMFVTMLYRLAGEPETSVGSTYTDVAADAWYAEAVYWASSEGVTAGASRIRSSDPMGT